MQKGRMRHTWLCLPYVLTQGSRIIHSGEKRMFWIGLIAGTVAWAALAFFELVRLKFSEYRSSSIAM